LVLIVPAGHRLETHETLHFSDVLAEAFVGLTPGDALQEHVEEHARVAGRSLTLRIRMKTFEGVCEMVAHGVGLGIIPLSLASRYRRKYGYQVLALADAWARRRLCLCFCDWHGLSAPMQSLLKHLGA